MSVVHVYRSSNGDSWDLVGSDNGSDFSVRHTPNPASGGRPSETSLRDFLRVTPHSAEHQAVVQRLGAAGGSRSKGYIHDPKEPGGPYIAVVLAANDEPSVTLHNSYSEAEAELARKLADISQTTLGVKPQ